MTTLARFHPAIGTPRKVLAGLAGGVVLAHVVVVQLVGGALEAADSRAVTRPFVTRAVALSTAPAGAPPVMAVGPVAATAPRKRPAVVSPAPRPAATQAVATVAAEVPTPAPLAAEAPAAEETVATAPAPEVAASAAAAADLATSQTASQAAPNPAPAPSPQPPVAAVAYTVPGSVRLNYKVEAMIKNQPWNLNGEFLWLQDGSTYEARLTMSMLLVGTKTYTSAGQVGAEGLLPRRFSDKFRSSEVAAHFERDKQVITFSANTPSVPLKPGMQDWLSSFVQIGAMFGGAPGLYPNGTRLLFDVVGPRSVDAGVFVVGEQEKLALPGGELSAIKLTRAPRQEFDQTIELWLAPQMGYLPVRIKITERNGDFFDQQWRATETP